MAGGLIDATEERIQKWVETIGSRHRTRASFRNVPTRQPVQTNSIRIEMRTDL